MRHTIVIPAYNEEARIEETVRAYASYVQESMDETEILIIVNGSEDRTAEIAHQLANEINCVRAWDTPARMGKGGAVFKGFELSQGEILSFSDADNATTPPELRKLLDAVESGADAAIASRWLPQSKQLIKQPFTRRILSRIFNLIVRILFFLPYTDTQCGAKAFTRKSIETVRETIQTSGWSFDVALIWRLRQAGFRIVEVPIEWSDNSRSRLRVHSDGPSMLVELIKLRFGG
ncbi:MAG: glycosyltransferase family 2 protein [Candidatus Hinthialibacter antarcticus]|nr:glycosyltransferase family 2 protein [Candidatus Hinthialibacter antarcticus]